MKLSQKRTCGNCKVYTENHASTCQLGFKIKRNYPFDGKIWPVEECYKPLTITELFEAEDLVFRPHV